MTVGWTCSHRTS
ncbi:hypothetical protein EYF80_040809 [Liparis tanakae]|uniref:Uncharacterized protein n=1 Tax=Liparis tanakae TaxID=230148 RepID=A0A4Z2G8X0_9TELE|nr:hypothetical protein EYF80_040809 [Liparis tanakae]